MAADDPAGGAPGKGASSRDEPVLTSEPAGGFEREVTSLPDGRRLTLYRRRPRDGRERGPEIIEP